MVVNLDQLVMSIFPKEDNEKNRYLADVISRAKGNGFIRFELPQCQRKIALQLC